jgi:hypothetical protein
MIGETMLLTQRDVTHTSPKEEEEEEEKKSGHTGIA